jgi:cell wall-associated NlpC family hydrolase
LNRRLLVLVALLALVPVAAAAASGSASWAQPQIKLVVARGLMGAKTPAGFRPDAPVTQRTLANLASDLQAQLAPPPDGPAATDPTATDPTATDPTATDPGWTDPAGTDPGSTDPTTTATGTTTTEPAATTTASPALVSLKVTSPGASVTMAQLDSGLVRALGFSPAAAAFAHSARTAGLQVPSRFGTEVVARLLGLRTNHPANEDGLELLPNDPATRAEAAYSAAQILGFRGWEQSALMSAADAFQLPDYTPWQKRILDTAVHFIGYPYIWGGTSENAETLFGVSSRGGFDCSGFVWRVYKLQSYSGEGDLASTLRGRTTFQMSGEVPRGKRIAIDKLEPGDVLFWGAHGKKSKPSEVDHTGIYLGNGWFIHSSEYGVAVAPLQGWYRDRFAWARRPLAEAGLE